MRQVRIDKVTLNMGTGGPGEPLTKALKLINSLSEGTKAVSTKTQKRIPGWKVRPGLEIGAKVTLRGKKAEIVLKRLLKAVEFKIPAKKIDKFGNFSFGIKEYLDVEGAKYDPEIGIMGLEIAVTLKRPGYRVKIRRNKRTKIGKNHLLTKEDTIKFMLDKFNLHFI